MSPAVNDRDFVLVLRWPWLRFNVGQIVVVKHPQLQIIIKRICAINHNQLLLAGENTASTSTEAIGWVSTDLVIGRVCWRIAAPRTGVDSSC